MIGRRLPAVVSPVSGRAIVRALVESVVARSALSARSEELVRDHFGARRVVLTDSGTSALVLALQALVPPGGVVAYPGYACVDLAAAAQFAGVRVRLYDLDPATLSPDLESVRAVLQRGVDALVVAHLFGYPADVPGVRELADEAGVPIIEDAAQGAGGTLHGQRLGSLGDVAVLSFGRGKGLCAGGGGALLGLGSRGANIVAELPALPPPALGWSGLVKTTAQLLLGRPSLYALPSMIPWLHLGEMVYHPAGAARGLSRASSALLASAFALEPDDLAARRRLAKVLEATAGAGARIGIGPIAAIPGGVPGYLRYPVRDAAGRRVAAPALGVLRSYPRTLVEQPELAPLIMSSEPAIPGATELRRTLFTVPTHRFVSRSDLSGISEWLAGAP